MEKKFDVIGFGDPFQDLDIQLSKLPETNVNMRMNDYCFMGGGNVPTAMVAAARLGLKSSILGVVGDDMLGRLATADFTYNHVDTSHLKVAAGKRTNFCLCVAEQEIDGKEFISKPGDFDPLTPSDLDRDYIQSAKALHIGQFTPAIIKACEWMHEAGGVVSIDAAYYRPDIYENYRHLDIFIGSETYYNVMCQTEGYTGGRADIRRVLRAIQSQGPKTVIFTFGADGCIGLCGDEFFEVSGFQGQGSRFDRRRRCVPRSLYLRLAAGLGRKDLLPVLLRCFSDQMHPPRRTRRHSDAADFGKIPRHGRN